MGMIRHTEDDYGAQSSGSGHVNVPVDDAPTPLEDQQAYERQQAEEAQAAADARAQAEAEQQARYAAQQAAQQQAEAEAEAERQAAEEAARQEAQRKAEAEAAALRAQIQARKDAINAANTAIDQSAKTQVDRYNNSKTDINNDYQKLLNQNSVRQYKSRINQRESLANRGNLDSGLGRMENLQLNTIYGNNENDILNKRQSELDNVANAINNVFSTASKQKADNQTNGLNDFNSALQNVISSTYSGYTPASSDYYQSALASLNDNNELGSYTSSDSTSSESALAAALKKQQDENAYTKLLKAYYSSK
jgi:DNA primase